MKKVFMLLILVMGLCLSACSPLTATSSNPSSAETNQVDAAKLEQLYSDYFHPVFLSSITAASWTDPEDLDQHHFVNYYTAAHYYSMDHENSDRIEMEETVSSQELEEFVLSHFDVSSEFLRDGEAYDKEKDIYVLEYLGGAAFAKIVEATQDGDILTMIFEYYSPADEATVIRTGTLKIQVTDDSYKYLSCVSQTIEENS